MKPERIAELKNYVGLRLSDFRDGEIDDLLATAEREAQLRESIEPDARLIAAASNLLAACRGLLTFAVPLDPEAVEHVYAARRAIEQATANH